MVKDGCRVAIRMEPLRYLELSVVMPMRCHFFCTHPMANVLQSEAGANAVMGSKMVLADRCSEVEGSNRMMLPCALPVASSAQVWAVANRRLGTHQTQHSHSSSTSQL